MSGPALVAVVVGNGTSLGGIELGRLNEVVRGVLLGDLFSFPATETQIEFGLGRSPGRMEELDWVLA